MPKIKGFLGEASTSLILSTLDKGKYTVINDLMLKARDRTTQIDHVVVSNYGIFVIETKNYKGWITGNEYDDYWNQTIYKRKERLYNPIRQNYGHIQALKEHLGEFKDTNFISIIVFTNKADLKVKTTTAVVNTAKLQKAIKEYNTETISDSDKEQIYSKLSAINVNSKENKIEHVKATRKYVDDKNSKIKNNICPRCGGRLVQRKGRYGYFTGCSNYPRCRFTIN